MGNEVQTTSEAWSIYDHWLEDPSVGFWQETFPVDAAFRKASRQIWKLAAPKAVGDCLLMALSDVAGAHLVTLDGALASACEKARLPVVLIT